MNRIAWALGVLVAVAGAAGADDGGRPAAEPRPVRVMSFNIRYGTAADGPDAWPLRRSFLADTIAAFDPDLLGTQETLADQLDFLRERFPHLEAHGVGRDDGQRRGEMAALFFRRDRFEVVASGHFWLSPTPDAVGSRGWDAALPRIASWVRLADRTAPGAPPLLFVNTHFDHKGATARLEAARLVNQRATALAPDGPVIVTGDFNAAEGSPPYAALFAAAADGTPRLIDAFRVVHPDRVGPEGTFNGFDPTRIGGERIDWIGCSPGWTVVAAAIDRTTRDGRVPSDHFPVTAVLERK